MQRDPYNYVKVDVIQLSTTAMSRNRVGFAFYFIFVFFMLLLLIYDEILSTERYL